MTLLINIVSFQCVWLSCVMGAGRGFVWLGPLVLLVHLALHTRIAGAAFAGELRAGAIAALLGGVVDSAFAWGGLLEYASNPFGLAWAPPWMLALWVGFTTTLRHALRWLLPSLALQVVLGGLAGAFTYWIGERLHAFERLASPEVTYLAIGIAWAVAMPLLVLLVQQLAGPPVRKGVVK